MSLTRQRRIIFASVGAFLLLPSTVRGQAWALPQGEGSFSVLYHHVHVVDHVFSRGERYDAGHIRSQVVTGDVEYGLTDRLSLRALLPFVATKYSGDRPHVFPPGQAPHGFHRLDDGTTHAAFQDFRVEARYGWREFPVAIAPFVAVAVPSHNYEVFAHSAVGLNMAELQVGTYAGVLRGPFAIQGRYALGLYEKVLGRRRNRSVIDAEIGWLARPKLRISVFQTAQISHGGAELPLQELLDRTISRHDWWPHHDQLARANSFNFGGGVSVRLTPSISVHGSAIRTLAGRNTHAAQYGVTAGTTWGFGRARPAHPTPNRP